MERAAHRPHNLLVIISDEHRKDAMGCAGHPLVQTPHLDKLAASPTGGLSLMVTHQVVITGITGIAPASGGFVAYNSRTGEAKQAGTPVRP